MNRDPKYRGGWVRPVVRGFRQSCCDCSLVHVYDFRIKAGSIEFRFERDNRATMNKRRRGGIVARRTVAAQLAAIRRMDKQPPQPPSPPDRGEKP
jgi:hypothetical protein